MIILNLVRGPYVQSSSNSSIFFPFLLNLVSRMEAYEIKPDKTAAAPAQACVAYLNPTFSGAVLRAITAVCLSENTKTFILKRKSKFIQ